MSAILQILARKMMVFTGIGIEDPHYPEFPNFKFWMEHTMPCFVIRML